MEYQFEECGLDLFLAQNENGKKCIFRRSKFRTAFQGEVDVSCGLHDTNFLKDFINIITSINNHIFLTQISLPLCLSLTCTLFSYNSFTHLFSFTHTHNKATYAR